MFLKNTNPPTVFVINGDDELRRSLAVMISRTGYLAESHSSVRELDACNGLSCPACVVINDTASGRDGLEVYDQLVSVGRHLPAIIITDHANASTVVEAMRKGVFDVFEKPYDLSALIDSIENAIAADQLQRTEQDRHRDAQGRMAQLTSAEGQVLDGIIAGKQHKEIATHLDVSRRTVEYRKASIMKKLDVESTVELIFVVQMANCEAPCARSQQKIQSATISSLRVEQGQCSTVAPFSRRVKKDLTARVRDL